jgi:quercetin dioxygenase-like cupin family protein
MIRKNYTDVEEKQAILSDGTKVEGVTVRWLIDENIGAKNFAMRRFEIKVGGKVPLHNHQQDHEIYILSGSGRFYNDKNEENRVNQGDIVYIPPNEKHAIDNLGEDNLVFICLVPYLKKNL